MKIRAIDVFSGKWVYGTYMEINGYPVVVSGEIKFTGDNSLSYTDIHFVKKETVSRSTESFDIDGTEIYENDIVETFSCCISYQQVGNYPPPNIEVEEWKIYRKTDIVEFSYGSFNVNGFPIMFDVFVAGDDCSDSDDSEYVDERPYKEFLSLWEDNYNNIQEKYPYLTWRYFNKFHVIGNIFKNPELLEEDE